MWISAFKVVIKTSWTDEFKKEIGEAVLVALYQQMLINQDEFKDDDLSKQDIDYLLKPNSKYNTSISVNTN